MMPYNKPFVSCKFQTDVKLKCKTFSLVFSNLVYLFILVKALFYYSSKFKRNFKNRHYGDQ